MNRLCLVAILFTALAWSARAGVLYSNGPLVTNPGAGPGGADVSALQSTLLMNTYGWRVSTFRLADDFTVPAGGWNVTSVDLYGYQTGANTSPSTFTSLNLQIWNGDPSSPGSSVIWGDTTTNVLSSSTWSGIYRALDLSLTDTSRPIMTNTVNLTISLDPGVYWLDWKMAGSLGSGPWGPPITILGTTTTGNALQYSAGWLPIADSGSQTAQGLPFEISGTSGSAAVPEPGSVVLAAAGIVLVALSRRRRR